MEIQATYRYRQGFGVGFALKKGLGSYHLGNVLATVLDRKTGASSTGSAPTVGSLYDHWNADLASVVDVYPYGMPMPGRNKEYSWSRMGYNGQAKDDEVYGKGNLNTAKFWEYDTRIAFRWNVDPKPKISFSPYSVFSGNPITQSDPNGDTDDKDVKNNPNAPSRKGGTERFHKARMASAKEVQTDKGVSDKVANYSIGGSLNSGSGSAGNENVNVSITANGGNAEAHTNISGIGSGTLDAGVNASAGNGEVAIKIGTTDPNKLSFTGSAKGSLLSTKNSIVASNYGGVYAKGEAGAYTAEGELSGTVTINSFKANVIVGGSLGSAHAGAAGGVFIDKNLRVNVSGMVNLGLGAGASTEVNISFPLLFFKP